MTPGPSREPVDGALVVDKPEGPTSHDVVALVRRALGTRAVGHTGTLDPMATGVLVLVAGRATRLVQFLAAHRKTYEATLRLGVTTDTWDRTGTPGPSDGGPVPPREAIEQALLPFLGLKAQVPPPYSAKKIDGTRAYVLARQGRPADVPAATVELFEARITDVDLPLVRLSLVTSSGYYVRSLVHELGRALGCGACLEALRRTASGEFSLDDAVGVEDLEPGGPAAGRVVPLGQLLGDLPSVVLDEAAARRAGHGNEIEVADGPALADRGAVRLFAPDGELLAIARPTAKPGVLHPAVVLR
jgi:tRNA pseudouridine55 synthase